MALELSKELLTGVSGNYWKIINVNHSPGVSSEIRLGLFVNKEASDSNKVAMEIVNLPLNTPLSLSEITDKNLIAASYDRVKLASQFVGSKDV